MLRLWNAEVLRARRYVYQKAYVEFFTSSENFRALEPKLKAASSITYMAVNAKGDMISNVGPTDVNAVTWGVFPAKEIVQPTVVDPQSFAVWKVRAVPSTTTRQAMPCSHLYGGRSGPKPMTGICAMQGQALAGLMH